MRIFLLIFFGMLALSPTARAETDSVPRTIIGLHSSDAEENLRFGRLHRFIEMPMNHMGFIMEYHEVNKDLPELRDDMVGIITWFDEVSVQDPEKYLAWLTEAERRGIKILIIGSVGIEDEWREKPENMAKVNEVLKYIGFVDTNQWVNVTYDAKIVYQDPFVIGFERNLNPPYPSYMVTRKTALDAKSYLQVETPTVTGPPADLVITSPRGGYVSDDYTLFLLDENEDRPINQWTVNPFWILNDIFGNDLPFAPDKTTLNGRRIFYAHIDGEGWNNVAWFEPYRSAQKTTADVLEEQVFKQFPDLGFTLGFVVAELDPECYGVPSSVENARRIIQLPNVEVSSHTYTHPLYWEFFQDYYPEKEIPFLDYYPVKPSKNTMLQHWLSLFDDRWKSDKGQTRAVPEYEDFDFVEYYTTPRSYNCGPFSLEQEIEGSVAFINHLSDGEKKVRLIQWSGNTSPYEEALRKTRQLGLYNINGGDSRLDSEFPSYSFVAAVGMPVGEERQIYSSNSNENVYTQSWTGRFFGYRYLRTTVENTESPIRVDPFNTYFHSYSAERRASLSALIENLRYARSQRVIPIWASDFAAIAEGFYDTKYIPMGDRRWRIENRGMLQTLRVDHGADTQVDFARSAGVLGQRYTQGSLYIALDPEVKHPVVALQPSDKKYVYPDVGTSYLVESRWKIRGLRKGKNSLSFSAHGFGQGEMVWRIPAVSGNRFQITVSQNNKIIQTVQIGSDDDGLLRFALAPTNGSSVTVNIEFGPL